MTVEFPDRVEIGNKLMSSRERADPFDLQVVVRGADANAIVLGEAFEEMYPLMDQAVPGFTPLVF